MAYFRTSDVSKTRKYFVEKFTAADAVAKALSDSETQGTPADSLVLAVPQTKGATSIGISVPAGNSCEVYYQLTPAKSDDPLLVSADFQASETAVVSASSTAFASIQLIPGPISAVVFKNFTGTEGEFRVELLLQE